MLMKLEIQIYGIEISNEVEVYGNEIFQTSSLSMKLKIVSTVIWPSIRCSFSHMRLAPINTHEELTNKI